MPFKIILLIALLWVGGVSLGVFLLTRSLRSFRDGFFFLVFCFVVLVLCYVYIPCFDLSGSVICHGDRQKKWLTLTFDDGPQEPYTSLILDILKKENIRATFFVLGKYVEKSPELIQRMIQEGHVVGNHGLSHTPLAFKNSNFIQDEVESWEKAMNGFGNLPSKIFRASHGWKNPWLMSLLNKKGYHVIGWDVGVWDSDQPGEEVLLERLKKQVRSGSIILLHDGDGDHEGGDRSQTVSVLPEIINFYKQQGYRFVTIPEMLLK